MGAKKRRWRRDGAGGSSLTHPKVWSVFEDMFLVWGHFVMIHSGSGVK